MQVNNLKSYLIEKNMTMKEFSEKLDIAYPYLSKIASGKLKPSSRLAREINRLTDGIIDIKRPSVN